MERMCKICSVMSVFQMLQRASYVLTYRRPYRLNDFYTFKVTPIPVPPPALVTDFRRLIDDPALADVQFLVENKVVYAHRAVLAIRSTFFNAMLCGGMRESAVRHGDAREGDMQSDPILLRDVSHAVFLKVLEFLYTDTVQDVSLETGIQLLIASEQFLLDRLKALCEDCIRRDIHVDTVIHILVAAHRHNASGLKDIALEYILRHLNDPIVMSGLADLKAEPELLLEIIKRSNGGGGAGGSGGGVKPYVPGPQQDYPPGPFGGGGEWDARR
jgi:leucine-zipper-like transcriptional regulator 1